MFRVHGLFWCGMQLCMRNNIQHEIREVTGSGRKKLNKLNKQKAIVLHTDAVKKRAFIFCFSYFHFCYFKETKYV